MSKFVKSSSVLRIILLFNMQSVFVTPLLKPSNRFSPCLEYILNLCVIWPLLRTHPIIFLFAQSSFTSVTWKQVFPASVSGKLLYLECPASKCSPNRLLLVIQALVIRTVILSLPVLVSFQDTPWSSSPPSSHMATTFICVTNTIEGSGTMWLPGLRAAPLCTLGSFALEEPANTLGEDSYSP